MTSRQHVGISCKAKEVPHEPKTAQGKQIWRAKPELLHAKLHAKLKLNLTSHTKTRAKCPQVLIALLMQLQHLGVLAKFLTARLELKNCIVLVIFIAM